MMRENRYIAHVDMDAFFASVEERDHPQYKGKPIIVGADPKKGKGRGVVSTCSYEARKYGIYSSLPISIAYRKCPQAVFLPVDINKYSHISEQIFNILKEFSPLVEEVSIDEAFLDISGTYKLFGTALSLCAAIKDRIKKETNLTASVGLAPTKTAAKIASGFKKPDGLVEVKKEDLLDFLSPLDVGKLWGVGEKTKVVLNRLGIRTIGDLAKRSKEELLALFGKNAEWFWQTAQGIDESEVITERDIKSISNERTFEKDTSDKNLIIRTFVRLCEQISDRLREADFKCSRVTLKIRLSDFKTYTRDLTMNEPTNFSEVLIAAARKLYEKFEFKGNPIRLLGVKASKFSWADEKTLFINKEDVKREKLHKAVGSIRQKFGNDSILRASSK